MKKLFLGLAVIGGSLIFAQEKNQPKTPVSFGIKAGMNLSTLTKLDHLIYDNQPKFGFNAGVFTNIPFSSQLGIQAELLYTGLGNKTETNIDYELDGVTTITKSKMTNSLHYLSLPVMLHYKVLPDFYIEAGLEFGILLGGKTENEVTETKISGNNSTTTQTEYSNKINKDNYNTLNVGIGIGAGYYFMPELAVTARYVAGLTDIYKNNNTSAIRNNVFQIGLAYRFK